MDDLNFSAIRIATSRMEGRSDSAIGFTKCPAVRGRVCFPGDSPELVGDKLGASGDAFNHARGDEEFYVLAVPVPRHRLREGIQIAGIGDEVGRASCAHGCIAGDDYYGLAG